MDEAEALLEDGVVSYRPPRSMQEGVSRDLTVRVQRDTTPGDPEDVPGSGPVVQRPIQVGTPMTATLSGATFVVRPAGPMTRVLGSTRPAEWEWTITPTRTGSQALVLELAVLLDADSETPIAIEHWQESIEVQVHPLNTSARVVRTGLEALGAAGVTAAVLVTAAWSWWQRRRRPPAVVAESDRGGGRRGEANEQQPQQRAPRRRKRRRR